MLVSGRMPDLPLIAIDFLTKISGLSHTPLEISCSDVSALLERQADLLLLDCREHDEHQTVNLRQAMLIPMSEFPIRASELQPYRDKPIVVYCHHGMRSAQVAAWLRENGFLRAQSMAGGIDRWAVEIDPGMTRY